MVQMQTSLTILDNSGAKKVSCLKILKKGNNCFVGKVGDLVIVSIKKLRKKNNQFSKIKKGEVALAILTKTKAPIKRRNGISLIFMKNTAVIVNKTKTPLATRIFGLVTKEIRGKKFSKLLSVAVGVI